MKKIIYFLAALIALTATSCKDDDVVFNNTEDLDRMPMPMFRRKYNTNISEEADMYASKVIDGTYNAIQLHWYGVEGAAGYQLRYRLGVGSGGNTDEDRYNNWDPANNPDVHEIELSPDQLHYEFYNLEYNKVYSFAIRALHPDGKEEHHSLWYGYGGGQEWEDYMQIQTKERYVTPYGIETREKDYDGFKVLLNLNWDRTKYSRQDADTIEDRFRIENNQLCATHLIITPSSSNPNATVPSNFAKYRISDTDRQNGFIQVTGLDRSSLYSVVLYDENNERAEFDSDKYYKALNYRTKGDPGKPIKFYHKVTTEVYTDPDSIWNVGERKYQACRLDTLIENFNGDSELAEGQEFLLEGGKAYYIRTNQSINKGFTLKTDPADILAGKGRAKVYLGGIARSGDAVQACNWNLGKQPAPTDLDAPIAIEKVIFQDIDFEVPEAINLGGSQADYGYGNLTANYFANMYSNGLGVEFESFELRNCTFQGMIRGFFRIQGPNKKVFDKLIFDNCVFFNQGYYDNNGSGYSWVAGAGNNAEDNVFKGFELTNCTFYDSPRRSIVYDNGKDVAWSSDVQWNVKIENNTFINFSTRSSGRYFFDMKYVPGGSKFSFKRNLICLAADANDKRNLHQSACLLETVNGTGEIYIDVCDNYSTGCRAEHLVEDGILTAAKFTANSKSFGAHQESFAPGITLNDLAVHVGSTPLMSTDLFNDPNPRYHAKDAADLHPDLHSIDANEIWTRLQYKNDLKVTTHEIYRNNIGDQRWKTADPKWFYPAGAPVPTLPADTETPAE